MFRRLDLRYRLSRLVPMPYRTTYVAERIGSADGEAPPSLWVRRRVVWLHWRGRVLCHRATTLGTATLSASG